VCIHSTEVDAGNLHCTFETRISQAGKFEILKRLKEHFDIDLASGGFWDGSETPFPTYPYIFKIVGDNTIRMLIGDFGETRKIAVFTMHDNCPKGSPGVQIHIAVWLVGPDGFSAIESSNDAAEAYLVFRGLLQGVPNQHYLVTYNGPGMASTSDTEPVDAPEDQTDIDRRLSDLDAL